MEKNRKKKKKKKKKPIRIDEWDVCLI